VPKSCALVVSLALSLAAAPLAAHAAGGLWCKLEPPGARDSTLKYGLLSPSPQVKGTSVAISGPLLPKPPDVAFPDVPATGAAGVPLRCQGEGVGVISIRSTLAGLPAAQCDIRYRCDDKMRFGMYPDVHPDRVK
jgi:hypothetical protein